MILRGPCRIWKKEKGSIVFGREKPHQHRPQPPPKSPKAKLTGYKWPLRRKDEPAALA